MVYVVLESTRSATRGQKRILNFTSSVKRFRDDWKNLVCFREMRKELKPIAEFETEEEAQEYLEKIKN